MLHTGGVLNENSERFCRYIIITSDHQVLTRYTDHSTSIIFFGDNDNVTILQYKQYKSPLFKDKEKHGFEYKVIYY